jgi:valyl-tRNA synthetase
LGKIKSIKVDSNIKKPPHSATAVVGDMELFIPLKGLIDIRLEKERLENRIQELTGYFETAKKTLLNKNFIKNAPESVIKNKTKKLDEMNIELEKLTSNLEMLK